MPRTSAGIAVAIGSEMRIALTFCTWMLLSACGLGAKSEIDAAREQADIDFHCQDVEGELIEPGYVAVAGCSQRATYECSQARFGPWSCRRMY
jgi:hypothetical protein